MRDKAKEQPDQAAADPRPRAEAPPGPTLGKDAPPGQGPATRQGGNEAPPDQGPTADQEAAAAAPDQAVEPSGGDAVPTERADEAPGEPAAATAEDKSEPAAEGSEPAGAEPAGPEPADPRRDALAAARHEAEAYLDDLRRLQAEFDNYRKRVLREQTARAQAASQALVTRLLPVLDNFGLAVSAAEQSRDFDRMLKGVEMVFGELSETLKAEGLQVIEAEGKPFDPERHEAVLAVEQEGVEPGMVASVVRTGYELHGKVLRPAMVKVAK